MVVHIGRAILLSEQSTPSCCPKLLACLVSCDGPYRAPRLPPLSAGWLLSKFVFSLLIPLYLWWGASTGLKHSCRMCHIFLLQYLCHEMWAVVESHSPDCTWPPAGRPPVTTSRPPTIPWHERFDPCHPYTRTHTQSVRTSQLQPRNRTAFSIVGVHSEAAAFSQFPVPCSNRRLISNKWMGDLKQITMPQYIKILVNKYKISNDLKEIIINSCWMLNKPGLKLTIDNRLSNNYILCLEGTAWNKMQ